MEKLQIGFDIGGTNIKAGIVNDEAEILTKRNVPFPKKGDSDKLVELLEILVEDMCQELQIAEKNFTSIGIAVPGSIDPEGETVIAAHNLGFYNAPLKAEMAKRFPEVPIFLVNDANAATLAEFFGGALKGCKTGVLLTLGTGVGGGIILNGKLFNGGNGHGVELGHMIMLYGGPECTCGNRGCVESVCTATWLTDQGRKIFDEGRDSLICQKAKGERGRINAKTVMDSVKEEDPWAKEIFKQYITYLSTAMITITSVLDPEVIALGGGVSLSGDFLYEPLRENIQKQSFFKYPYKIVPAELGNDAGVIGAAMLGKI